jgi:predicted nucleotide-binding protein
MTERKPHTYESLCARGRRLLHESHDPTETHSEFEYWDRDVANWLDSENPDSGYSATWSSISTSPLVSAGCYNNDEYSWAAFRVAVQRRLKFLGEVIQTKTQRPPTRTGANDTRQVFLVHGHDEAAREKVARYLEKLELKPIILHEQANKGRTIIEKFTDYADVAYAVVLLTADDIGGPKGTNTKQLVVRARPNVLFELGYFIGKLGRDRVCALHETGVEILSDYSGVIYVTLDANNAWRLHLAREMKAAGLPIDMNNAI